MKDIYQAITDRFLEQLEQGTVPWRQPWVSRGAQNLITRKPYRGCNAFLLGPSDSPFWLTFRQARELGGTIKSGEKSTPIVFWKFSALLDDQNQPIRDSEGREKRIPLVRYSNVFNLSQTEGIPSPKIEEREIPPIEKAEKMVQEARLCPIQVGSDKASYSPAEDVLRIPERSSFRSSEDYYHVLFHEMTHATGHQSRLNRPIRNSFGSEAYAKEELVAEMGAAFLSNEAGTLPNVVFENSASYLNLWRKTISKDPRLVVQAASQAQHAADFIRGRTIQHDASNEPKVLERLKITEQDPKRTFSMRF